MPTPPTLTRPVALSAATLLAVSLIGAFASRTSGGLVFDEAVIGDFSDNGLAPTAFVLRAGTTQVAGTFGASPIPDRHDLDYVSVTVPDGHVLARLVLLDAYVGGAFSFVALQAGPAVTVPPDNTSVETPLLGWAHFGSASIGSDLLPEMAASPGSVGFQSPLPAGTYSLWIMELDSSESYRYRFGFEVAAIPGPGGAAFAMAAATLRGRRRRR